MKKKKVISLVMVGVLCATLSLVPSRNISAHTVTEMHKGEIVSITNEEQQFIFNADMEGEYTLYSNGSGVDSQIKMSLYDKDYKLIKSDSENFTIKLNAGKYFVKIESKLGLPLNYDFGVIGDLNFNNLAKVSKNDNTTLRVYKLSYKEINDGSLVINTCSNENDDEDTLVTLYDANGVAIDSNDDLSYKCKFSSLPISSKISQEINNGEDYYIKVEAKDKNKPLSTGLVLNDSNVRNEQYIEYISPKEEGYFLKDEKIDFVLYGSPAVESIAMKYKGVGVEDNDPWNVFNLGTLYRDEKTNTFRGDINATSKNQVEVSNGPGSYVFPTFLAEPKGYWNQTNGKKELKGYITSLIRDKYMQMDKSWYYNSPYDHSFVSFGTGKYNCYAYALDMNDENYGASRIPQSIFCYEDFDKFMMEWQYRDGPAFIKTADTELPYSDLICYGISNHFAKVTEWDSNGKPTRIVSKWGQAELIESNPYDLVGYGKASFWASGKYTPNRPSRF